MQNRLLLIAYYFPPLGLSGVQRVLKWAKYLPDNGWAVTVLTPSPASYFALDESLLGDLEGRDVEIVRTRSVDPTRWVKNRGAGLPGESRRQFLSLVSQALLQPDNKIGWYPFAVDAGLKCLRSRTHHAILSSAPPYTSHLIGARLSQLTGIPLTVDYRDDWIQNPRHTYVTDWHRQLSVDLEAHVFSHATRVLAINDVIAANLARRVEGLLSPESVHVVPHGYDPDDLVHTEQAPRDSLEFLYNGVFYDAQQPDAFLQGLARYFQDNPGERAQVTARFTGHMPPDMEERIARLGLQESVILDGYLPHRQASERLMSADILWMTVGEAKGAEMISTSKLFEYIGTGKPILGLVPEGTARDTLTAYGRSMVADPHDIAGIASAIAAMVKGLRDGSIAPPDAEFQERHDRRHIAARLARLLTEDA